HAMFPQSRFLHLVGHPRGQGASVMKYLRERRKLGPVPPNQWLLYLAAYSNGGESASASADIDPRRAWLALHRNICEFLHAVPASHTLRVRGEDIVSESGARYARSAGLARLAHGR